MRLASQPTRRKPSPGHAVWPTPTPVSCTPPPPAFARSNTAKPLLPPLLHPFNQTWPCPETTVDGSWPTPSPRCLHPAGAPYCSAARRLPLAPSPQSPRSSLLLPDTAYDPAWSTLPLSEATQVLGSKGREQLTGAPRPPAIRRAPLASIGEACGRRGQVVPLCRSQHFPLSFPECVHLFTEPVSLTHRPALPGNPHRPPTVPGLPPVSCPGTSLMPSQRRCYDSGGFAPELKIVEHTLVAFTGTFLNEHLPQASALQHLNK